MKIAGRLRVDRPLQLAALVAILAPFTFRVGVQGDGVSYFSYLPAWFRGSVELGPEYVAFLRAHTAVYLLQVQTLTATGHHENLFPIGPAVLSLPFYALARLVGLPFGGGADATWLPGIAAFNLASLAAFVAGLILAYRLAMRVAGTGSAFVATLAAWLAGPLLFYSLFESDYSHNFSFFAVALFLTLALSTNERAPLWRWAAVGAAGGLMAMTRWQDGLYMLIAAVPLVRAFPRAAVPVFARAGVLAVAFLIVVAPQILVTHAIFGYWLPRPGPDIRVDLSHPALMQVLFASHHGLFTWAPVLALGAIGLFVYMRRKPWLAGTMAFVFVAQVWVNASLSDWWQGIAFGGRRFIGAYPLLILGLAVLIEAAEPVWRRLLIGLLTLLTAWNLALLAQFAFLLRGDVDPGYGGLLRGQLSAVPELPRLLTQGTAVRDIGRGMQHGDLTGVATGLLLLICVLAVVIGAGLLARRVAVSRAPLPSSR